jgi:hypothetical protein
MKNKDLRDLIVSLRDNSNPQLSFKEIADILWDSYGIKRSRQAVYGMYMRGRSGVDRKLENISIIRDAVYLTCLGYTMREITDILSNKENHSKTRVNYNIVRDILKNSEVELEETRREVKERVLGAVLSGESIQDIYKSVAYFDNSIKEKELYEYLKYAYMFILKEALTREAVKIYMDVRDIDFVESVIKEFYVNYISMTDIRRKIKATEELRGEIEALGDV